MSVRSRMLLLAAVVGVAVGSVARADRLDAQLNQTMPLLVDQLKKKYKNVGVLRFRVADAGQPESFASPLAGRMAERVETLLVLHAGENESKALGVIHNAGVTAARAKIHSWYASVANRKKLFDLSYPLAWGTKEVKADVFLTGKVEISKDRSQSTVTLEYFDKSNPEKLQRLATIRQKTDRFVLRDLGYSYVLSRSSKDKLRVAKRSSEELDEYVAQQVQVNQQQNNHSQQQQGQPEPKNIGGIEFTMLVNQSPVQPRRSVSQNDPVRYEVTSPEVGAKVAFRLRNTTKDKTLGVVLRLNGLNTINEQTNDPESAMKWVIEPGKSYLLNGFYEVNTSAQQATDRGKKPTKRDDQTSAQQELKYKPFKILVGEDVTTFLQQKGEQMGSSKGLIEIDVFENGTHPSDPSEEESHLLITPRGLPPSKVKQARSSFNSLKTELMRNARLKTKVVSRQEGGVIVKRELIVADDEAIAADQSFRIRNLENPFRAAGLSIRVVPLQQQQQP